MTVAEVSYALTSTGTRVHLTAVSVETLCGMGVRRLSAIRPVGPMCKTCEALADVKIQMVECPECGDEVELTGGNRIPVHNTLRMGGKGVWRDQGQCAASRKAYLP